MVAHRLRRFWTNRGGASAVTFALSLLPLAAGGGMALDYSRLIAAKSELQSAMDASVLAAATSPSSDKAGVASQYLLGSLPAGSAPSSSFATNADGSFSGTATLPTTVIFGRLLGHVTSTVSAKATAVPIVTTANNGPVTCLLALDPVAQSAFNDVGITNVRASCRVVVDSSNGQAVVLKGQATLASQQNCIVGGVSLVGGAVMTPARSACTGMADPFRGTPTPSVGNCTTTNYKQSSFTGTLSPGVYCGGISLTSSTATFSPGVYIIKNGGLSLGSGTFTGKGVVFYFTGTNTSVSVGGNAVVNFVAPTTGTLASFVYFFDPSASASGTSTVSGTSQSSYEGVLYMPNQDVSVVGTSDTTSASPFTAMIANTFHFAGNATVTLNANPSGTQVPVPAALLTPGTPTTTGWRLL